MDYSMYLQKNEDGTMSFDSENFEKAINAEIDRQVSKGVESFKTSYEKKANEAKMSEQEKFEQEKREFEEYRKNAKVELITAKAKAKLEGKGFSETEVKTLLNFINDDEEASLSVIDTLVAERTKFVEDSKKKTMEELQKAQPTAKTSPNNASDKDEAVQPIKRTAQDIKNRYK
jgi:hypothetical protein